MDFASLGLPAVVQHALKKYGWKEPTTLQQTVIPELLCKENVLVVYPPKSGKTTTLVIKLVSSLASKKEVRTVIVVSPTQESCARLLSILRSFAKLANLSCGIVALDEQANIQDEFKGVYVCTPSIFIENAHSLSGTVLIDDFDVIEALYPSDSISKLTTALQERRVNVFSSCLPSCEALFFKAFYTLETESQATNTNAREYFLSFKNDDDILVGFFGLLKSGSVKRRLLVYSDDSDLCYRLYLTLSKSNVKSSIVDSNMPQEIKSKNTHSFQTGSHPILIVTGFKQPINVKADQTLVLQTCSVPKDSFPVTAPVLYLLQDGIKIPPSVRAYNFDMSVFQNFKYRVMDVIRSINTKAVKNAREQLLRTPCSRVKLGKPSSFSMPAYMNKNK